MRFKNKFNVYHVYTCMQANDKNCHSSLWCIRLWIFLKYLWTVSWDFHEYCSLNVPQIFMNSFMRNSWMLPWIFIKYSWIVSWECHESCSWDIPQYSWTVSWAYYESVIHKMFMNSYFHELCHLTFMRKPWIIHDIFHESSWRIHEYLFMNDSWANIHSFLFMNYYFHELCHLTFTRKFMNISWTLLIIILHEYLFMKCSWTKTCMNFSFMNSYFDELLFWWTVPFNVHARAWTVHVFLMDVHEQFSWTFHE